MDIYAKGQLSYLILNCLMERDFYGLDIISEIKNRSNGRIDLKKPSVYSNLTRMEKQGQVSSYMRSSDLGPNRRYYSLTEKGRIYFAELKEYFDKNHIDVFHDFVAEDSSPIQASFETANVIKEEPIAAAPQYTYDAVDEEEKAEVEQDYFDFSMLEESEKVSEEPIKEDVNEKFSNEAVEQFDTIHESAKEEVMQAPIQESINVQQINIMEAPIVQEIRIVQTEEQSNIQENIEENVSTVTSEQSEIAEVKAETNDDAVLLPREEISDSEYNKRIYDITKDFNKYRKRRSFAEDQIAIVVDEDSSLQLAEEKRAQKLETFKTSLLENKEKYSQNANFEFKAASSPAKVQQNTQEVSENDDGVFITARMASDDVLKSKKIEPPRLKIMHEPAPLPAPKRDATIDPSHKEIISKLYSKSKGAESELADDSDALFDYEDLKDHYRGQQIMFKVYEHDRPTVKHNTNKINLNVSLFTFSLICIISAICFAVLYTKGLTNPNTSFLYIILPGLCFIDVCCKIAAMRYTSWEPKPPMSQLLMWALTILNCGVVVGLNFIFGLNASTFMSHFATLIYPIALIITLLPVQYYIKRFAIIKFWK